MFDHLKYDFDAICSAMGLVWYLPSGLVLIQRELHQGFAERKQLNQISQLANYVPENFNPNWSVFISSDLHLLTNISLFIPFWRFSRVNPNILTKICGFNHFLFDNLSFRYAVLLHHFNFSLSSYGKNLGILDLIPNIL